MRYLSIGLWVALFQVAGGAIGYFTGMEIRGWYDSLEKPAANPPNWIFPVVWPILYVLIALAGERLWRGRQEEGGTLLFRLFLVQTLLNWLWSPLFFNLHMLGLAFVWIVALNLSVLGIIVLAWGKIRWVSIALIPYLLWGSFAAYLNYQIWQLNF